MHPNDEQATAGFIDEANLEEENKSFFSPRGKEEIVCAITDTDIKFGFRPMKDINNILALASNKEFHYPTNAFTKRTQRKHYRKQLEKFSHMKNH